MNERYYQAVIELINAYERGLILSLNKKHTETTPKILMMAPLLTMEAAIETSELGFDLNFADVASRTQNSYKEPVFEEKSFAVKDAATGAIVNVQNNKKVESVYEECLIDGQHITGSSNPSIIADKIKFEANNIDFEDMYSYVPTKTPVLKFGYKATNDFKYKIDIIRDKNVSKWIDEKMASFDSNGDGIPDKVNIFGWKTNFGLENCLNCFFDVKFDLYIPALEWGFDLSKLLNKIKNLLQQMKAALDPTGLMLGICAFLEALKNNGICPKNLPPLAMLLPTLFSKYTFDMLGIRLNLTGLFLPLLKTILGAIISTIENFPRLINPIFDCLINGLIGVNYIIKNYISAYDKIVNESISAVNTIASVPKRTYKNLKNLFSYITTSDEEMLKEIANIVEDMKPIEEELKSQEEKRLKVKKEIALLENQYDKYVLELYDFLKGTSLVNPNFNYEQAKQRVYLGDKNAFNPTLGSYKYQPAYDILSGRNNINRPFGSEIIDAIEKKRSILIQDNDVKILLLRTFKKYIDDNFENFEEGSDNYKVQFESFLKETNKLEASVFEKKLILFNWLVSNRLIIADVPVSKEPDGFLVIPYETFANIIYGNVNKIREILDGYMKGFAEFHDKQMEKLKQYNSDQLKSDALKQTLKNNYESAMDTWDDKQRRAKLIEGTKVINEPTRRNVFTSFYEDAKKQLNDSNSTSEGGLGFDTKDWLNPKVFQKQDLKKGKLGLTTVDDPFLATYGVQGKLNYIEEPALITYKSKMLEKYNGSSVNLTIERGILYLKELKAYINIFFGNLINSFKALSFYIKDTLDLDIKINGSILEILHLIRFFKLIYKLIQNGLTDCKKIKENPKIAQGIINQLYTNAGNPTISVMPTVPNPLDPSLNQMSLETINKKLTVANNLTGKKYHIDAVDCQEIGNVKLNDSNLEDIYKQMLNNFYNKG